MLSYLFKQKNTFVALLLLLGSTIATPVMASSEAGAMVVHELQQQGVTLKGIVKDANGEPIIGASVVEKEKTTNGNYGLERLFCVEGIFWCFDRGFIYRISYRRVESYSP